MNSQQAPFPDGTRFGERVVLGFIGRVARRPSDKHTSRCYRVLCSCGGESLVFHEDLKRTTRCGDCARQRNGVATMTVEHREARNAKLAAQHTRPHVGSAILEAVHGWPQLWCADSEESIEACTDLAICLGGMQLAEVAIVLGLSVERVRQIEGIALGKLRRNHAVRALASALSREPTLWEEIELLGESWEEAA